MSGIDKDEKRRSIVRAIAQLATTAEGVETESELECVRTEGRTNIQGELTGRPQPAEAATNLLIPSFGPQAMKESTR